VVGVRRRKGRGGVPIQPGNCGIEKAKKEGNEEQEDKTA
jgi:hypothetical protein